MVMILLSLALALLPAFVLVFYFYKKDSLKREPTKMIRRAFLFGILSTLPAIVIELNLGFLEDTPNPWLASFTKAFIVAALVEELSKLAVLRIFIYKNPNFDEIMDGIVYMAIVSLGFAGFENVMYAGGDMGVGLVRAFTAVPGHAIWSGIMGYYIGLAKVRKEDPSRYVLTGLAWGVGYHGVYDFVLFAGTNESLSDEYFWLAFLIIPILVCGGIQLGRLMKKAKREDAENEGFRQRVPT